MREFTTEQLLYLAEIQVPSVKRSFIRSLQRAGHIRSNTEWKQSGRVPVHNARPVAVLTNKFESAKTVAYEVFAVDQTCEVGQKVKSLAGIKIGTTKKQEKHKLRYRIESYTLCGWEDVWTDGGEPVRFASREEALSELDTYLAERPTEDVGAFRVAPCD